MAAGLRERKKVETRQAIADAALALAVDRGPTAITVDDIAEAADVSPRTVFNHFATKDDAILGLDPDGRRTLLVRLAARPAEEPPLEALRQALHTDDPGRRPAWRRRARLVRDHPHLQAAYVASFARLEDDLTAAVAERTGRDPDTDPYPRLVVTVALTTLRVAVQHAIDVGRVGAMAAVVDEAFAAVASGLPVPGGDA